MIKPCEGKGRDFFKTRRVKKWRSLKKSVRFFESK